MANINSKQLGNLGERMAENYLKEKGYQILDKNYSFRIPGNPQKGEIDIVAKKSDIISFIEVKTLLEGGSPSLISPEEKVLGNVTGCSVIVARVLREDLVPMQIRTARGPVV